jgi:hypothetical protein
VVWCALGLVALLAVGLLLASLIPGPTLANRLFGAAGEARTGAFAQDLSAHVDARLRFLAAALLGLVGGLLLVRHALEDLLSDGVHTRFWPKDRPTAAGLVLIGLPVLVALGVRLAFLNQPMRYDEALTYNEFASRPLYYGLSFYPDPNNHVLNTLLMHTASTALGSQPWVLRLPALLAGVLLVGATYWLGRLLFDALAGFLGALLVAVSSYLVEYSTNARGYTLQALCFVVLLCLTIVAARRGSRAALLGAAVVAALGAFAVPTMLYGVAIAAIWYALERRRVGHSLTAALTPALSQREREREWEWKKITWRHLAACGLLLGLLVAVLYLPVSIVSGPDKLVSNRFVVPLDLGTLSVELPRSLAQTWTFWNRDIPWLVAAILLVGFALGSLRVPLGIIAVGVCLVCVLLQRVAPFERVWLFLLPLYLTIAAGGLAQLVESRARRPGFAVAFGGAALLGYATLTDGSILTSTETGTYPDAQAVAQSLAPRLAPDDAVVTMVPASLPELQYYFPRAHLPIDVLVRTPEEAQNLWVLALPGAAANVAGWGEPVPVQQFAGSTLYELKRPEAGP